MKLNTATRVVLLIFGIILVILGFVLFATPGIDAVILGYIICIMMVVFGIAEIVFYGTHRKVRAISGWVLADGIMTAVLGLLLFFMPAAQVITMSIIFAVWVMMSGIMSLAGAFSAKDAGSHDWGWYLVLGILGTLLGIWLMFDPMLSIMSIGFLLPIAFIFEGVTGIATFFSSGSKPKEAE